MMLLGQIANPPSDTLSMGLGIAAVVLVAGWALTRWQRDRLRFALMRTALERGLTRFPGTPPYWLMSLRQGVTLLALGAALGIVGSAAWWLARGVEMPTSIAADNQARLPVQQAPQPDPQGSHEPQGHDDHDFHGPHHPPPPPPREDPLGLGPRRQGPPGQGDRQGPPQQEGDRGHQPRAELIDPARERWHRAEAQQTIGQVTVGAGLVLVLLGIVRIAFAKLERRFASESDENALY
jgi:hypothetical protein